MTQDVTLLIVDDEPAHAESLARIFEKEGWTSRVAHSGAVALEELRKAPASVVITDLNMPGMNGAELLRAIKAISPETEVVLMTAFGTVETAVAAMKDGAYDFVTKPLKRHAIVKAIRQALEKHTLVAENRSLRARLAGLSAGPSIVGRSPSLRATLDTVRQAALSSATVLLVGETGTGKELFARALHDGSPRVNAPFVAVNCAAIPETILESELFGYERGAFTGAAQRKEGRFERAHGGTLFLDEVAEMSPAVQVKLLRVLQDGEIERLGGTSPVRVDVRIVAATNKDLATRVTEGAFREDLFYRLNVITVQLPPLRDRREDIPLLADHFLKLYTQKNGKTLSGFTRAAVTAMEGHTWPGNVRELEHAVERAVVLSRGAELNLEDLPLAVRAGAAAPSSSVAVDGRSLVVALGTTLEEIELRVIHETLRRTNGDKDLAAQILGISVRTIYRKLAGEDSPLPFAGEG